MGFVMCGDGGGGGGGRLLCTNLYMSRVKGYTQTQALSHSRGYAGRRTAAQGPSADRRQIICSTPAVVSFTPSILPCKESRFEAFQTCLFRQASRHRRVTAAPAPAASAAPSAPLNSQTGALHRLRTNIPSCKNADVESPTLKYPERILCKKVWRKPNKKIPVRAH